MAGIQVLPSLDRFAGLRQGANNFVGGLLQQRQQQAGLADQQSIMQFMQARQQGQQPAMPQFQTPQGAAAFNSFIGQQQENVALGPGQGLFNRATGQQVGQSQPVAIKPKAGPLQIAGQGDESGLPTGTVFQFDPQGNAKIVSEAGSGNLSASDKARLAISQGKEFRDTPTVKNFRTVETMERGIQSALKIALNPKTKSKAFADQALVIGFNKLLDPSSVVRESEFARTPQGIALLNRLKAGVEKIGKGGVGITNADRQALAVMAARLLNESKRSFNATFNDFEARSNELGLNTKVVFGKQKLQALADVGAQEGGIVQQGVSLPSASERRGGSVNTRNQQEEAEMQELLRLQREG